MNASLLLAALLAGAPPTPPSAFAPTLHVRMAVPEGVKVAMRPDGRVSDGPVQFAVRPGYFAALSEDSKRSLGLQGGIFNEGQAEAFISQPGAAQAVRVRVWDDLAKVPGLPTPPLSHFLQRARRCTQAAGGIPS